MESSDTELIADDHTFFSSELLLDYKCEFLNSHTENKYGSKTFIDFVISFQYVGKKYNKVITIIIHHNSGEALSHSFDNIQPLCGKEYVVFEKNKLVTSEIICFKKILATHINKYLEQCSELHIFNFHFKNDNIDHNTYEFVLEKETRQKTLIKELNDRMHRM